MAIVEYWRHMNLSADENGLITVQSANPAGHPAFSGAVWIGGDTTDSYAEDNDKGDVQADGFPAPVIHQWAESDAFNTVWTVALRVVPYSTVRVHIAGFVEEEEE